MYLIVGYYAYAMEDGDPVALTRGYCDARSFSVSVPDALLYWVPMLQGQKRKIYKSDPNNYYKTEPIQ
jgi:hypothetical protein